MFGPIEIPNKSSFKINEVCGLTGVKSYVLRFWESEFPEIAPITSTTGQKLYEHRDIEAILMIKKMLFEDKLTIERAKAEMNRLMPSEKLVEDSFQEAESELYSADSHNSSIEDHRGEEIHYTKRILIESEFQKLMTAKSKLVEMLELTERLKQKNKWS